MVAYQVMVEGVFVKVSEGDNARYGFHSTFFLEANNASNATHRIIPLIKGRLVAHGISEVEAGILKTYFLVQDIWEISSDKLRENQGQDLGFTFFRIGRMESIFLYLRRLFLSRFKPWLVVLID